MKDIVDDTDFCRKCRGAGSFKDETERGTVIFETCWLCRGSGLRTISATRLPRVSSEGLK